VIQRRAGPKNAREVVHGYEKNLLALAAAALMGAPSTGAFAQDAQIRIGFLPGVVDPFYQVMQIGVEQAAEDLGIEVVTQVPPTWGVEAQTPL
jgi:ABC-type sugar transport system substrate-binding protein